MSDAGVNEAVIADLVLGAIADLNKQLPRDRRVDSGLDAKLSGGEGPLDSLGLVNLMVNTEQRLETSMGVNVMLADEAAGSDDEHFNSVRSFVAFVKSVVEKSKNE